MTDSIKPSAQRRVVIIKASKHRRLAARKGDIYAEMALRRELFKAGFAICPTHLEGDADCTLCKGSRAIELTLQPSLDQRVYEQAVNPKDDAKLPTRSERLKNGGNSGLILP